MILGTVWLKDLGPSLWDFTQKTLKFWKNRKTVILQGVIAEGLEVTEGSKLEMQCGLFFLFLFFLSLSSLLLLSATHGFTGDVAVIIWSPSQKFTVDVGPGRQRPGLLAFRGADGPSIGGDTERQLMFFH